MRPVSSQYSGAIFTPEDTRVESTEKTKNFTTDRRCGQAVPTNGEHRDFKLDLEKISFLGSLGIRVVELKLTTDFTN